jgi:hypothetical protein
MMRSRKAKKKRKRAEDIARELAKDPNYVTPAAEKEARRKEALEHKQQALARQKARHVDDLSEAANTQKQKEALQDNLVSSAQDDFKRFKTPLHEGRRSVIYVVVMLLLRLSFSCVAS